jgi:V8-like Glu-specific endopeptidase
VSDAEIAEAGRSWTPDRIAGAEPRDIATIDDGGAAPEESGTEGGSTIADRVPRPYRNQPDRMVGKVFGSDSGGDYSCSGAVVQAQNRSVVWTAGHCVYNTQTDEWADDVVFIPAYSSNRRGQRPYGTWVATNLWSHVEWTNFGNYEVDVGAIVVRPQNRRRIQQRVGAHYIRFGRPTAGIFRPYGYPAQHPFSGFDQWRCASRIMVREPDQGYGPQTLGVRCDLNPGASGGPWLRGINRRGVGTISSLSSYRYLSQPTRIYGPYMGSQARVVYFGAATDPPWS